MIYYEIFYCIAYYHMLKISVVNVYYTLCNLINFILSENIALIFQ